MLTIAIATRPHPGETENGDRVQVDWHNDQCRIAVIDGLGHGPEAAADAAIAARALTEHPALSPADALYLCDRALRGRRGAAISIATISVQQARLEYAGIGNVEARVLKSSRTERLIAFRGIVGVAMRTVRSFTLPLEAGWLLAIHTDGVSQRFETQAIAETQDDLNRAAHAIIDGWGRQSDDATVVLAVPDSITEASQRLSP